MRVAPSLEAYPREDTIMPGLERELARARLNAAGEPELNGNNVVVDFTAQRPTDERVLRYFQRSDLFSNPKIEIATDGLSGKLTLDVARNYFLLGTDNLGRDLMTRIFIGVRMSLAIGLLASAMALVLGVSYGAVSGYLGGRIDNVMMRLVDILYSLPFIFFVILMLVFFGRSIFIIFIAIGATEWLDMARIVRGQTLSLKRQEFVQAAEALGATRRGVITRHIIPNALGPRRCFRDASSAEGNPARKSPLFSRSRRSGPPHLSGAADFRRFQQREWRELAIDLACRNADHHPVCAELPR